MDNNKAQINFKEMLQICRNILNDINSNSLFLVLREQNENFNKALDIIEQYLPAAENILDQDKAGFGIKTATIFLIMLWAKLKQGCSVADLNKSDWNDIIGITAEKTAMTDPREYSLMVFDLYRRSIEYAIKPMSANASNSVVDRLGEIVSLMEEYAADLKSGAMPEVKFIEENLWLSIEAIFLIMTDRLNRALLPENKRELAEAASALVFQKFRYSHYDKELTVIDKIIEHQGKLDQRLKEQVNSYIDALNNELDEFDALVEKAFNTTDPQAAFRGSIDLATKLDASGILMTPKEVDDYFMS